MSKFLFFLFIATLAFIRVDAQNAQQHTHFMFNQLVYNPAYAGYHNSVHINALYRQQWTGIEGAPALLTFSAHSPLNVGNSNAGFFIANDVMGAQRTTHIHLAYAYRKILNFGNISFGLSAGLFQHRLDGSMLRAPQGNYESSVNHNDDYLPNSQVSALAPEVNTGIYLTVKSLQVGVSANNIIGSKTLFNNPNTDTRISFARYYTTSLMYFQQLGKKFTLIPSALLKTDFLHYQTDFSLILQYKDNFYIGSSFRGNVPESIDAASILLGVIVFKNLRIGYSYDISLSALNNVNNGSHEIFAGYRISLKDIVKPGKAIYNPRFL